MSSNGRRRALALAALLCLALVLRVAAALVVDERELRGDEGYYVGTATEMHQQGRHPGALRPPAYPAFIASVLWLTGDGLTAVRLAQALLSLVVVALVFDVVQRRFGTGPASVSALLCTTSPTLIHYTQIFWAETLGATGLMLLVWSFDRLDATGRHAWALLAGFAIGVSALTREMLLYFAPVAALCLVVGSGDERRSRLAKGALLLVTCLAIVTPWAMRNRAMYGQLTLSTNRWLPIALGNLPSRDGTLLGVIDERPIIAAYKRIDDPLAAEAMARRHALDSIAEQQPWWILRKTLRTPYFLFSPVSQLTRFVERGWVLAGHRQLGEWLLVVERAHYVVLMCLGIGGLWLVAGGRTQLLVVALILFHVALYTIANANHRFRVPLLPLFALYAGPLAFGRIAPRPLRRARVIGAAACVAAFVLIVAGGGELHGGPRRSGQTAGGGDPADGEER